MTRATQENSGRERNFNVLLRHGTRVNGPWLERVAMEIEDALINECAGDVLGPSVTANFEENGFEVDLTVEADDAAEAYRKLGRAFAIIERVAEIEIDAPSDEIRSAWSQDQAEHQSAVLA